MSAASTKPSGENDFVAHDSKIEQSPLAFRLLHRIFQYSRPYARKRNTLIFLVLLRAGQLAAIGWMIGAIINGPIAGQNLSGLFWATGGFAAFAVFTALCQYFRERLALEFGESILHDLRGELFQHLLKMPVGFFHKMPAGRIISRLTSDVESVRVGVQEVLFISMVNLGQMAVVSVIMLFVDPVLFLIILILGPVLVVMNLVFRRLLSRAHREVQESFSRVTANLAESVSGIRETQGFARQKINADRFANLVFHHSAFNIRLARISGAFVPLLGLTNMVFLALLLVIGGFRVLHPEISAPVGTLIQFIFLASIFFQPIQTLGNQFNNALNAMAGAERVFRLLDTRPEWTDSPTAQPLPRLRGAIEFEHVSFAYEEGRVALNDVSFSAREGTCTALVGHTGSGKSSIVNLLTKFYPPTSGRILVDHFDLAEATSASLHSQIGIVQQSNFLFTGSILENIRLGRPEATEEEVRRAAAELDCADLLETLPEGFHTKVRERGSGLSLGQRQLVCFVRAMIADPRILILDEATSSIDTITEARIQQALVRLMRGRTSLVVAHRMSTIRHADQILVLEHGRIIEQGTHPSLLEKDGLYANLYRQFAKASTTH